MWAGIVPLKTELGLAGAKTAWGICQCCLQSVPGDHSCSSMETSGLTRNSMGYHMLCCAPRMPLRHFFVEGRGAGGMEAGSWCSYQKQLLTPQLGRFSSFLDFWSHTEELGRALKCMLSAKFRGVDFVFIPYELSATYVGNANQLLKDKSITESKVLYYWHHGWASSTKSQIGK